MKVFLSWSGERSRLVATALCEWLPLVLNDVSPFVSSNMSAGARWQAEIAAELAETNFGILCVTAENQDAPWLNFEAGALAKTIGSSKVIPLAIDLTPADIRLPLGQFQSQTLDQQGVGKIVLAINDSLSTRLPATRVEKATRMLWSELEKEIQKLERIIDQGATTVRPNRSDRELLEDILNSIRGMTRAADVFKRVPLMGRGAYSRRAKHALHLAVTYATEGSGARVHKIYIDPDNTDRIIFAISGLDEVISRKLSRLAEAHGYGLVRFEKIGELPSGDANE